MKVKENLLKLLDKASDKKTAVVTSVSAAAPVLLSAVAGAEGEAASGSTFTAPSIADSVTTSMFNGILTQMTDLLPIVLPVVVACLAFRKGISFLKSMIAGA